MAINGLNSGTNDIYSSIFGTSSSSSTGNTFSLGDQYMIRNGTYKKLMKAYYTTDETESESSDSTEDTDSKTSLLGVKANAASLNNSLEDLKKTSLFEAAGEDEEGNKTYDREKILDAVKSFVEDYNDYIKSSGDLDNVSLLRKSVKMTKLTDINSGLLSQVGIEIKGDNTLELDEEQLNEAKITTLTTLFNGVGSYGDQVQQAARQSYQQANSLAYNSGSNSSYNVNGGYAMLGSTSGVLNRYL